MKRLVEWMDQQDPMFIGLIVIWIGGPILFMLIFGAMALFK